MGSTNAAAALVIVDMLVDYFREGPLAARRDALVASINDLVDAFRQRNLPVIWIRQEFRPDLADAFLEMRRHNISIAIAGTAGSQILEELRLGPGDPVVVKKRYSAFFGTELDHVLSQVEPRMLVVAGVNTHACVRTTIIDAYQRDFDVVVADDCVASYDAEHHASTKRYLDNKIATFLTNTEIKSRLDRVP